MEPPSEINPPGSGPVNPPGPEGVKMEPADHPGGCTSNYFPCEWCNKTFTSSPSYKRHIWYHKQSFECKKCPMVFTKFQDMKLHQTVHQCGKKKTAEDQEHNHECQICGKRFKSLAWFETHMENHKLPEAEETLLFCNLCNLSFCQKSKYKLHLESHQEGERKIFKCRKCHKTLPSRTAYKSHLRTHLKKRFRCQGHCDKTFSTKQLLLNHLSNGINDNRICDKCGKIFINLQALHKHKENHKKAVSNSFYCEKCNSKFSHQRSFEFHILRVHTDTFEKNNYSNQCRICQKVFSAKHTLAYHMLMHTEPRCFKCDQCSFSSKIKEVLDQHLQHHEQNDYEDSEEDIHSKPEAEQQERLEEEVDMLLPQEYLDQSMEEQNSVIELDGLGKNGFACDQCPRKFKKQYLLDNHLKVHKGGKFFTCIQCHGTFAFMNLGLHKNMCFPCYGNSLDLSDTNLACTQCPRTFPSKFHLLMHLKIHNTGKFLKCEYCDGCFPKNKNCKGAHKDCPVRKAKLEEVKLEIEEPYELEESDGLLLIKKEVPYEAEEGFKYKPFSQTMRPYMDPREEEKEKLEDLSGVQLEDLLPMDKDKKDNLEVFDVIDLDTYSNDLIGMGFTVKSEEETFGNVEKQEDIEDLMNDLQEIVSGNDGLEDPGK